MQFILLIHNECPKLHDDSCDYTLIIIVDDSIEKCTSVVRSQYVVCKECPRSESD